MTGKLVAMFLIFIVIAGIALAIYRSGILSQAGNFLSSFGTSSSTASSSGFFSYIPPSAAPAPGSGGGPGAYGSGGTYGYGARPTPMPESTPTPIPSYEIPPGLTAAQLSPYFHQVRFGGFAPNGSYGSITFYTSFANPSTTVDVTGWDVQALRGGEYIPQAVNLYDPSGLTPASDIILKNGDVLYLYSGTGPVNLRLNECVGYLPNRATQFAPNLPLSCPALNYSAFSSFSGACQNYIQSLGSCMPPNLADPRIPQNDYSCVMYLENHLNYHSCYYEHASDPNFLSNQIWVFMGGSPFDPFHNQVELLDRSGLVVDTYSY